MSINSELLILSIGIVFIVIGLLLLMKTASKDIVEKNYGAVIVIGPLPIILGSSRKAAVLAGVIALVILVFILMYYLMS